MRSIALKTRCRSCRCRPVAGWVIGLVIALPSFASGQQIQSGIGSNSAVDIPQTNLIPIGPPPSTQAPSGYGSFDPYAVNPNPATGVPSFGLGSTAIGPPTAITPPAPSVMPSGSLLGRMFSRSASSPIAPGYGTPIQGPVLNAPMYGAPGSFDNSNVYGPPVTYGSPGTIFPDTVYPSSSPTTLFPEGLFSGGIFGGGGANGGATYNPYRLFQGPRLRHSYVGFGNNPTDLNINDTDASLVFAFPNFLYSSQPLYVVPSFSLHLWDGPESSTGADLPGSAYSGFLDVGWNSDPNQMIGTELGVRVGAFTDFDTFTSDSIRVLGKGLVSFRLTPASTLKVGAYYLDRNDVKLVPAGGVLWQPNPYTRFDIFFPQPKLARYWQTIGTRDVWWYVTADYGGGSWTVQRASGMTDSVDINDIRAIFGLEWGTSDAIRAGRRTGFFEVGYVFDREVEYRFNPADNIKPEDGIMFRAGIGY